MRWYVGVVGAVLGAGLALAPARAASTEAPTPIRVKKGAGAEGCPEAKGLADATNLALRRTTLQAHAIDDVTEGVQIVVDFVHGSAGFTASIHVLGGERAGERSLSDAGATCDDLAQAVTITLAVMLDEGLPPPAPHSSASASSVSSSTSSSSIATPIDSVTAPSTTPASTRAQLGVSAGGGAMLGVVRPVAPYAELSIEVAFARALRIGLGGFRIFPQRFDEPTGGFVEVSLLAGELFGCATILSAGADRGARVDGSLCASFAAGGVRGRTEGLAVNGDRTRPWLSAGANARLDGRLSGPFGWTVHGGAFVQRPREVFDVRGGSEFVYQPAIVGFSLGIGLSATIL